MADPHTLEDWLPPHHRATKTLWHGRFENPWPTWEDRTFADVRRWNRERRAAGINPDGYLLANPKPSPADFARAFPLEAVDCDALAAPPGDAVQAVWVGHATLLVQLEGVTFLTDPVFSQRASPVQWLGPRRVVPPALTPDSLPKIDFVLISHNHYDHLDAGSVAALNKRHGKSLRWYVPLGLGAWFRSAGVKEVVELDWWSEVEHPGTGVRIVFTPAQHWSWRKLIPPDRKSTLWGSFAVLGRQRRFWFAGDTGYAPVFKEIGEKLGPFDLAAIPTGAYAPRWFMRPQHIDPGEAVRVHSDVHSLRSVAMHCCTFALTDEALDEPPQLLREEVAKAGLPPESFVTLRHGGLIATAGGTDLRVSPLL